MPDEIVRDEHVANRDDDSDEAGGGGGGGGYRRHPTPVEPVEGNPVWDELLRQRGDYRRLEDRIRQLEQFQATVVGGHGAPGALERLERGLERLAGDLEKDLAGVKAMQEVHTKKIDAHDHVFMKVMIAATTGGAVVGVLVNLLFQLLNHQ